MKNPPKTNNEIRQWYIEELGRIQELNRKWIKEGLSLKERAEKAWQYRHDRRLKARSFMKNAGEVELLRSRDAKLYGSPNGPTFNFLVKRLESEGLSEDEVLEAIIKGSYKTNAGFDKQLGF